MNYTATEYTKSQTNGKPYRVGWRKFETQKQAEHWARQRLAAELMAPHWIAVKAFRSRRALCEYHGDGSGNFRRVTYGEPR